MKNLIRSFAAILMGITISGLAAELPDLVTKSYEYKDFYSVMVSGPFKVKIVKGLEFKTTVKAQPGIIDKIKVVATGKQLNVSYDGDGNLKTALVEITMPDLVAIKTEGACETALTGFSGRSLSIDFSGASSCNASCSYDSIRAMVSGASKISLTGKGINLQVQASGASTLQAETYPVDQAIVDVSGASNVKVNAKKSIQGQASAASSVSYKGNPSNVNVETSGASSLKKAE